MASLKFLAFCGMLRWSRPAGGDRHHDLSSGAQVVELHNELLFPAPHAGNLPIAEELLNLGLEIILQRNADSTKVLGERWDRVGHVFEVSKNLLSSSDVEEGRDYQPGFGSQGGV